ncbi:MAG: four helix bundle protein [Firmicutes bacterium]|nr:four helix bundle protein [Bacillota bacterium]
MKNYKELEVWQVSRELVKRVYLLTKRLPRNEQYGLTSQMCRAAVSIPSNIAEGHSRNSTKEYIQFLAISRSSSCELETQCLLCVDVGYLSDTDIEDCLCLVARIGQMINALIKKLDT